MSVRYGQDLCTHQILPEEIRMLSQPKFTTEADGRAGPNRLVYQQGKLYMFSHESAD